MKALLNTFLPITLLLVSGLVSAATPADGRILHITNPPQTYGIHIGDTLQRTVQLELAPGFELAQSALPVKGTRIAGIELSNLTVSKARGNMNIYTITLDYQVFAQAAAPAPMVLPAQDFAAVKDGKTLILRAPEWRFWFAPLVAPFNLKTAKASIQPALNPAMVSTQPQELRLIVFAVLFIVGLLGLVYVNADRRWLPFMGGPFARAHRRIKRLRHSPEQQKQALFHLHKAFNQTFGASLFAADVERFIERHQRFASLKTQIAAFFESSDRTLFAGDGHGMTPADLVSFSRSLRDSERGVK